MKQLLEIRSVPISIEYKVNNAQVKRVNSSADLEITRNKGGLSVKSRPIKLNVDTFEARNSISPSPKTSVYQNADNAKKTAFEAGSRFSDERNVLLNIYNKSPDPLSDIITSRADDYANIYTNFNIKFIPDRPADISWTPSELNINYEMDKLNFDWKVDKGSFEFIPGNVEFSISEYPGVVIEYVGGPIYVPPSANPDYEPIDEMA